jgi:hypothetical protein
VSTEAEVAAARAGGRPPGAGAAARPAADEAAARGRVARLFGLKGDAWMRHANPLSVWTRFSCLSLIALAIWSREWLGWFALVPVALSVVWLFVNPLLFRVPSSTRTWASRGVFGERIWVDREKFELPAQFRSRAPMVANALSLVGLAFLAYGLVTLSVLPTVGGIVIVHTAKLWYIDRMVLLFEDMKQRHPEYAAWEY